MGFKVLASDPLATEAIEAMRGAGLEVDEKTDLSVDELKSEIGAYDAIVIRSTEGGNYNWGQGGWDRSKADAVAIRYT